MPTGRNCTCETADRAADEEANSPTDRDGRGYRIDMTRIAGNDLFQGGVVNLFNLRSGKHLG